MPCPHCKITIIKRSENESAVSAAAYQSGEKLFSEYDQEQKYYPYKNEVTHKEILLPPHVPPEYADRNTLWNSAEAQEKQWNSQLARRFVLAIPREIPSEQYADLLRDYCQEFFVSKGMIADFAIHDKGDGNPHAHRKNTGKQPIRPRLRRESEEQKFKRMERHCFRVLSDYYHLLRRWKEEHAPRQPDEAWNPRFVEALQNMSRVEYLMDVLLSGELSERAALITGHGKEVRNLERRMAELTAADTAGTKEHGRKHRAAPER